MAYAAYIWLALVVAFGIIEAATAGLTVLWFAIGSAAALIAAALGGPVWLQVILFIVISLACLIAIRPLAKKRLKGKIEPTNADRIIGMEAKVTEDIDNLNAKGAVEVNGVTWTARSENKEIIPAGSCVRIIRIEGVKVFVEAVN